MADFKAEFDSDKEATKETLTKLISKIGALTWDGDSGTFKGEGRASGVKGNVSVAEGDGVTTVQFGYSLPFKLKMFGGMIDDQIRSGLEKGGGRVLS